MAEFNKLRKIFRILFPVDLKQTKYYQMQLMQNPFVNNVKCKNNNLFHLTLTNDLKVIVRGKTIAIIVFSNEILISNNFIIFESGELTIGLNKQLM